MGSFKTYSQLTHWSHQDQIDGYIENLPTIKVWVNCLKTLNKLSMYLPGKTPSAPSDWGISAKPQKMPKQHSQFLTVQPWIHRMGLEQLPSL